MERVEGEVTVSEAFAVLFCLLRRRVMKKRAKSRKLRERKKWVTLLAGVGV